MKKIYKSPIIRIVVVKQHIMLNTSPGYEEEVEQLNFFEDEEEIKQPIF